MVKMNPEKLRTLRFNMIIILLKEDPELLNMIVTKLEEAAQICEALPEDFQDEKTWKKRRQ